MTDHPCKTKLEARSSLLMQRRPGFFHDGVKQQLKFQY